MNELNELLKLKIPINDNPEDGFLEIIRKSHRENINSNIYAYFLDADNNEGLAQLFIESLISVINTENIVIPSETFNSYSVDTEVKTENGSIDIAIDDDEYVIIIENKLYHHLNNPLEDYLNHYSNKKRIGVLLTLEDHPIPDEVKSEFINIKHIDWINEIRDRGLPSGLPLKLYIYLNDFFQTITNHTKSNTMNDEVKFFFDHTSQVEAAINSKNKAQGYVWHQMEKLARLLNLDIYKENRTRYEYLNFWSRENHKDIYYTVNFKEMMEGKNKITIIIEFSSTLAQQEALTKFKNLALNHKLKLSNKAWKYTAHFLYKEYELNTAQIEDLANFIYSRIKEDFESVFLKLIELCYKNGKLINLNNLDSIK
ncbi:PD-(D/E)XK nuclease family protein [bacterium]|nr:PD-(D/E)XK nuclease family protein [bacterium]